MGCFFNRKKSARDVQNETIKQLEERVKRIEQQSIPVQPANKATVENMAEAQSAQDKPRDNFWSGFDKWNKLLTALISASVVIAAVSVHIFLVNLNSRHLFASIVSQPSVFLSVVVLFFVFLLIVLIPVYIPLLLAYYISGEFLKYDGDQKDNIIKNGKITYIILIICTFFIQIVMVLSIIYKWIVVKHWILKLAGLIGISSFEYGIFITYALLSCFGILIIWLRYRKYLGNTKWYEWCLFAGIYFCMNAMYSMLIVFTLALSNNWFNNDSIFYGWIGVFLFCNLISMLLAYTLFDFNESNGGKKNVKGLIWLIPSSMLMVGLFMISTWEGAKLEQHLFQNLGYIETSKQARWYLLDKRYTDWYLDSGKSKEKEVVPGQFSAASVELWRNKFFPNPFQSPNVLYGYKSVVKIPDPISLRYPNALYGYMAWNLGDIKIFCPVSVGLGKQVADKCLYIKGEYLQPLPTDL